MSRYGRGILPSDAERSDSFYPLFTKVPTIKKISPRPILTIAYASLIVNREYLLQTKNKQYAY